MRTALTFLLVLGAASGCALRTKESSERVRTLRADRPAAPGKTDRAPEAAEKRAEKPRPVSSGPSATSRASALSPEKLDAEFDRHEEVTADIKRLVGDVDGRLARAESRMDALEKTLKGDRSDDTKSKKALEAKRRQEPAAIQRDLRKLGTALEAVRKGTAEPQASQTRGGTQPRGQTDRKAERQAKVAAKPAAKVAAKPAAKAAAKPAAKSAVEGKPKQQGKPKAGPKAEPQGSAKGEPAADAGPKPKPKTKPAAKPAAELDAKPSPTTPPNSLFLKDVKYARPEESPERVGGPPTMAGERPKPAPKGLTDLDAKAVEAYRRAIEMFPRNANAAQAQSDIGKIYQKAGMTDKALAAFRKALERYPDSIRCDVAQFGVAEILLEKGDLAGVLFFCDPSSDVMLRLPVASLEA